MFQPPPPPRVWGLSSLLRAATLPLSWWRSWFLTYGSKQTVVGSWSQTSFISTPKISPRVHNFHYSHWNHTPGVLAYDIIIIGRTVPAFPIRIELIFDHSSGCSAMSRLTTSPVFFGRMLVPPIALQYLGNGHSNNRQTRPQILPIL